MTTPPPPWRIVFMGTPDFAVGALQVLIDGPDQVVGVFTQEDKRSGRGMKVTETPVKRAALAAGLPVFQPKKLREPEAVAELRALKPDLVVVAAYGQILSKEVLELPPHGCVNIHASLLPRWRGAAPIQRALLAGDQESGVTIMQMDEGLDTGDVLSVSAFPTPAGTTGGELHDKLAEVGADLLLETVAGMKAGTVTPEKQPDEGVTYAKKLTKADGALDWGRTAEELHRQVCAMNPWPACHTGFNGGTLKVIAARLGEGSGDPGVVIALDEEGPVVACGSGAIVLTEVQAPGKKRVKAPDWLRGRGAVVGDRLG